MKLQDAYVAESGVYVGNWNTIGYNMPGSNNFVYDDQDLKGGTTELATLTADKVGWTATNNAKLNDCVKDSKWTISLKANATGAANGNPIAYTAATPNASCKALTPNFEKIGQ